MFKTHFRLGSQSTHVRTVMDCTQSMGRRESPVLFLVDREPMQRPERVLGHGLVQSHLQMRGLGPGQEGGPLGAPGGSVLEADQSSVLP